MHQHLILYHSRHGQTKKICDWLMDYMKEQQNLLVHLIAISDLPKDFSLQEYDSVLFCVPIYYGKHDKRIIHFIQSNEEQLMTMTTGIFSINLTARKPNKNKPETNPYLKKMLRQFRWQPDCKGVIAGALKYPDYVWYDRWIIQLIMKLTSGPVDTKVSTEFTDWHQLEHLAARYSQLLLVRPSATSTALQN